MSAKKRNEMQGPPMHFEKRIIGIHEKCKVKVRSDELKKQSRHQKGDNVFYVPVVLQ
jgi:hypothetical protein